MVLWVHACVPVRVVVVVLVMWLTSVDASLLCRVVQAICSEARRREMQR